MKDFLRPDSGISPLIFAGILLVLTQACTFATSSVTLAWNPSLGSKVTNYDLYYGGESGDYTNKISTGGKTSATISGLIPGYTYYFAVTAFDRSGLQSPPSNEAIYTVPPAAGSLPPTLNPIADLYITENASAQTVSLSGISAGAGNVQKIKITAVSGNHKLLGNPKIRYASPGSAATLTLKPGHNAIGTTTITVMVKNQSKTNNLARSTFRVIVLPQGQATPAVLIPAPPISGQFTVNITGTSGLNYVVEASTNLIDWVPMQTNTAPFAFTDVHAGEFNRRFYRSTPVQ